MLQSCGYGLTYEKQGVSQTHKARKNEHSAIVLLYRGVAKRLRHRILIPVLGSSNLFAHATIGVFVFAYCRTDSR